MQHIPFSGTRIIVPSPRPYQDVLLSLESVVGHQEDWKPAFEALVEKQASWQETIQTVNTFLGSSGFMLFATIDVGQLLSLAGTYKQARQYVLGNPLIANQMMEYDPGVALYVPLRLEVYEQADGTTLLAYDQPSSLLEQFQQEGITSVAHILDHKLHQVVMSVVGNSFSTF